MPKLVELLNKNKMTLIVALPGNDPELAEAAISGGADALQLSINVKGSEDFKSEKEAIAKILKFAQIPVGVMIGGKESVDQSAMKEMIKLGVDFVNVKIEHAPSFIPEVKNITKVLSLGSRFTIDVVLGIGQYGANAINAAIIPSSEFGKVLIVGDLQNYISIVISAGIPVIVPTQRSIRTSEVAIIADTGAKGLMLTTVVTGTVPKHVEKAVREYRIAVDDLG